MFCHKTYLIHELGFVQKELSEFVVFGSGFAINLDTCFPALPIVSNALDVEEVTSYCGSNKAKIQSVTYMGKCSGCTFLEKRVLILTWPT